MEVVYANPLENAFSAPLKIHYGAIEHNLYTSEHEGWGNGYLEGVLFGVDQTVNQYPVFLRDIGGRGEDIIRVNGRKNDSDTEEKKEHQAIEIVAKKIGEWLNQSDELKSERRLKNWGVGATNFDISQLSRLPIKRKHIN